ncbi:MAG: hypothetical protein EBQ96_02495 [Proteobacteria bacterium]|nr:hypothetical protein [Pseudomonadota bacterium]
MRSIDEHTARIQEIFAHQGRALTPADFIAAGVNPVFAWLYYKNFMPEAILDHTNFADRILDNWPAGLTPPSPEMILDWVLHPSPANELGATHIGQINFDWKAIRDICYMLKITPDMLMPRNHSVHSNRFNTEPAPSEFVEAGTQMFLEIASVGISRSLLNFHFAECQKADRLGYARIYPGYPTNAEMMARAENAYDTAVEETPEALMTSDGELPASVSPTAIIKEEIYKICREYEEQMGIYAANLAKDIEMLSHGSKHYERIIKACSSAVAPMSEGGAWLHDFNEAKRKKGLEWAIKEVLHDPEAFHPVKQFFSSSTAVLPDGRTVRGRGIINAFCEAYRAFVFCRREEDNPKKITELAMRHDATLSRITDFRTWRTAPQTETYFRALANARHIEYELGGWIPGPKARQTPREGKPVLRLAAPQRPART